MPTFLRLYSFLYHIPHAPDAAKSLQSYPTLCDPIDGSPPGSPVPGILQARTLEWVAISFSNAWKWKWSCSVVSNSSQPHGLQPTKFLHPWDFPGKSTGVGCHCLLPYTSYHIPLPEFNHYWNFYFTQHRFLFSVDQTTSSAVSLPHSCSPCKGVFKSHILRKYYQANTFLLILSLFWPP